MKSLLTLWSVVGCVLLALVSCEQAPRKLLLGGSGWSKIVIIDKETKKMEWEYPLDPSWECNSVAATPDGNILFSYGKGAKLISRDKQEVWDIAAPEGCEMQTARVLPDGNYLLAWCGQPAKIMEVSPEGTILTETDYDTGIGYTHAQFRQVNKNKEGNYLVPLFQTSEVREVTPDGACVKTVNLEGTPFSVAQLKNGNYMVACGDGHMLMEVDMKKGKVVRKIEANDIKGVSLFFVAQLLPVGDQNLYVCNWQGHDASAKESDNPQLMEIDSQLNVVWSLNDNDAFGMISSVCPID